MYIRVHIYKQAPHPSTCMYKYIHISLNCRFVNGANEYGLAKGHKGSIMVVTGMVRAIGWGLWVSGCDLRVLGASEDLEGVLRVV